MGHAARSQVQQVGFGDTLNHTYSSGSTFKVRRVVGCEASDLVVQASVGHATP